VALVNIHVCSGISHWDIGKICQCDWGITQFIRVHDAADDARDLAADGPPSAAPLRHEDSVQDFVGNEPREISPAQNDSCLDTASVVRITPAGRYRAA
jgi:hypothetical protein